MPSKRIVLASGSASRRALLARFGLPFEAYASEVDERVSGGEAPPARAERLAIAKARALEARFAGACVIGSDQVAVCAGTLLEKPGNARRACEQLAFSAGRQVDFFTATCVIDLENGLTQQHVDRTIVHMRKLTAAQIERYVEIDQPRDCAGGFKAESLGIALFERVESSDPTALIGLPLIWLASALARAGIDVLQAPEASRPAEAD